MKLSMYVSDDCDGRSYVHDIALPHQDFLGFLAYFFDQSFAEELLVAQPIDARVEIEWGHPRASEQAERAERGEASERQRGERATAGGAR